MRSLLSLFAAVLMAGLAGCGLRSDDDQQVSTIQPPSFVASVAVSPLAPFAGRRVSFNLETTNTSPTSTVAAVELSTVDRLGRELYLQTWEPVTFKAQETWNLTHGFITPTDVSGTVHVRLVIRDTQTGDVHFEAPKLASFMVAWATADGGH